MCHHCLPPSLPSTTRRSFLKNLAGTGAAVALAGAMPRVLAAAAGSQTQPGHTGWARLVTPSPNWKVHDGNDATLATYIRNTMSLPIDEAGYAVKPSNLDDLCRFPVIFTNDLAAVRNDRELLNLREYLYRGGFLYIDACINAPVTPSFTQFADEHFTLLARLLPGSQMRRLNADHPIFHIHFNVDERELSEYFNIDRDPGLYAVIDDDRIVALVSLDALLCGWPQDPRKGGFSKKAVANIYAYAVAH
jgi:hypothetical protein